MTISKPIFVLITFIITCIKLSETKCSDIPSGLYCTNLERDADNETLIVRNEAGESDVQVIYLRNSSGEISYKTISNFPKLVNIEIQFSSIDKFLLKPCNIGSLYLIYNTKFPVISADFMKECCENVSVLYIVGNDGLKIEAGGFKHMKHMTHLTVAKQNITNLTKDFFDGLTNLAYLNLQQNGIMNIEEDAFENLTELNHLILSHNNLTNIHPDTFRNLKSLEAIDLYGLNFSNFNISIFNNQNELKLLNLPKSLIKKKVKFEELIKILPKLEAFGFLNEDKEDPEVAQFIKKCKATGYNINFSNISYL